MLFRLPALVAAAAYLAAAVGGTGLHGLIGGGHAGCDHGRCEHVAFVPDGAPTTPAALCEHEERAGRRHAAHDDGPVSPVCGDSEPSRPERDAPAAPHDPHHCAVCQFLAMGQQIAEAPRPLDAAGAPPCVAADVSPSVGRTPTLTRRVRGPPAAV
ncbi:hypothetical protein [Alienimonas sp. DA493]|uniref:hypothetical protein n=1 Tax=Alienimonas sp. DA493 TaxID=3373605 RepID=UPI00375405A1